MSGWDRQSSACILILPALTSLTLVSLLHRLGLSLVRLPDTFHLPITTAMKSSIPQFAASSSAVHAAQSLIMMTSLIGAISLTQKLCDDNKVGIVRYLAHATVQVVGAFVILYLMLSPDADTIATAY